MHKCFLLPPTLTLVFHLSNGGVGRVPLEAVFVSENLVLSKEERQEVGFDCSCEQREALGTSARRCVCQP